MMTFKCTHDTYKPTSDKGQEILDDFSDDGTSFKDITSETQSFENNNEELLNTNMEIWKLIMKRIQNLLKIMKKHPTSAPYQLPSV